MLGALCSKKPTGSDQFPGPWNQPASASDKKNPLVPSPPTLRTRRSNFVITLLMSELLESPYRGYLPDQLVTHLQAQELQDSSVEYVLPPIVPNTSPLGKKVKFTTRPSDVRLPARIASPLIPYPKQLQSFVHDPASVARDLFHSHHTSQLDSLAHVANALKEEGKIPEGPKVFDIDSLKRFARQKFSRRENLIAHTATAFAKRATCHDLSIAAATPVPFVTAPTRMSAYLPFIIMIQRLRVHIAKEKEFPIFSPERLQPAPEEAQYTMFANGVYVYRSDCPDHRFYIMACGGHFRMYHDSLGYWFCGPATYLDYVFSIADILNNLDILGASDEYAWAAPTFSLMVEFAEHEGHHKDQVDFMKGLEGFLLNLSDYDENFAMNWKPILETTRELWILDQRISGCKYDYGLVLALMSGKQMYSPKESFLCRMITIALKLTRTQRQEISALHKLIFYAEVSAEAGVKKFLKRVHTPRIVDTIAVKNITRLAKQLFLLSYKRRHKSLPNVIAPAAKIKLLEMYTRRGEDSRIEMLPLSWWDDVKIFDCMDNTLTTDPLEFAKDKGALKDTIAFGPGDSRKELLQVIEREQYVLKDFFGGRMIRPLPKSVRMTSQQSEPSKVLNPARLIEKEREQKWEARLFANAELENKHSLSLVAAKMKKALSYVDEQLMTPTDQKRKSLIHDAARELSHPDNYSLLLDIEGHNQSMQHANTSELSEFIGHLFGQDGWGDLPHYFSQLTVYHYDEYLDQAMVSTGQLGGIEGWLNPLWTMHTTLMMKLLRTMTDLTVKRIMVYSDDVDAILQIPQASEPMVQAVFQKIMTHCSKFGMTVKYSQTTLSKHRITMLRQHYADGIRADSTLKRLLAVSAGNNPVVISDELEVAGICSSSASALELSNHNEACAYLKNYKLGLLLSRLPQMVLRNTHEDCMLAPHELPKKVANVLYYTKEDASGLRDVPHNEILAGALNDIAAYLGRHARSMNGDLFRSALYGMYGVGVAEERLIDNPDRVLYLQIYDEFIQDLLFFWTYLPSSLGGLGASLHVNLILSGHSIGLTKSLHYLFSWIKGYASEPEYFMRYLSACLSVNMKEERNTVEHRLASANWPGDGNITPATTSVQQAIRNMVRKRTVNKDIKKMFDLSDDRDRLGQELINVFRKNFHSRVVQFYHENTSMHFVDLLLNKVETSSGLLTRVRNITRLRNSLCSRAVENIRNSASTTRTFFFELNRHSDIVECLLDRKCSMFPKIDFVKVEEVLYDDKICEVDRQAALLTVRRCSPTHYRDGRRVYDDPKVGNETLYKGELLDDNRMLGHKEELLAAKLVAVTKWFLTKSGNLLALGPEMGATDVVRACNLSLSTLTRQEFRDLINFAPTETGGEILHRIPNLRFSTSTYIRSEMNKSLNYTTDLNQRLMTTMGLVDSNVNVDYLRMRLLVCAILRDKYPALRRLVTRYGFSNLIGIKDVQFVKPQIVEYTPKFDFKCYGEIREHILSEQRFRYLAHSYMYEENMNEWALMPNMREAQTAKEVGESFINDIIVRYARDLDKDYLLIHPTIIDKDMWAPLIAKLDKIDKMWRGSPPEPALDVVRHRLLYTLNERGRMTLLDPRDRVVLELQKQCLDRLDEIRPVDHSFEALSKYFSKAGKCRRNSGKLNIRLAQYQQVLAELDEHRRQLSVYLIIEYIITFHFKAQRSRGDVTLSVEESYREFEETGLGAVSAMIVAPALQFQILVLGHSYVEQVTLQYKDEIKTILNDLTTELSLVDIDMPVQLPSLPDYTLLHGKEQIPDYLDEIEYIITPLPLSAMLTFSEILPLCKFAHRCSTTGAAPEAFTSHTGSDSLGAQIGLFRALRSAGWVDTDTRICDLTAGRGDGLYALNHLGLNGTSYTRRDTFTRLNHHPDITFRDAYDVFDGNTLKFINEFDHIHVDISFPGTTEANLLDLVLLLEENNLQYTIRVNSVTCTGYTDEITAALPHFDHYIAYAGNSRLKPYQIYLCGRPASQRKTWIGPPLRSTMAFRAMTVSFAKLLSPVNYDLRLEYFEPNSVSIQLPKGRGLHDLIMSIAAKSIETEQKYYLGRYMQEVGDSARIAVVPRFTTARTQQLLKDHARMFEVDATNPYLQVDDIAIGNVSAKSLPYHERHLAAILESDSEMISTRIHRCNEVLLEHFRTHHPVSEVRTWCNISLGLLKFCRTEFLSGHAALENLHQRMVRGLDVQTSLHQREIFLALKLLLISAARDNYGYGVSYCRGIIARAPSKAKGLHRTLRIYRLASYAFPYMQQLLSHGQVDIRSLDAITNSVEVRERARYKYAKQIERPAPPELDPELADKIIGNQIEQILEGLERYSQSLVDIADDKDDPASFGSVLAASGMVFDIGIEQQVEAMIDKLKLVPSGPRGIIDLGDDDIEEYDDW